MTSEMEKKEKQARIKLTKALNFEIVNNTLRVELRVVDTSQVPLAFLDSLQEVLNAKTKESWPMPVFGSSTDILESAVQRVEAEIKSLVFIQNDNFQTIRREFYARVGRFIEEIENCQNHIESEG